MHAILGMVLFHSMHFSSIAENCKSTALWKQLKGGSFKQMAYNQEMLILIGD